MIASRKIGAAALVCGLASCFGRTARAEGEDSSAVGRAEVRRSVAEYLFLGAQLGLRQRSVVYAEDAIEGPSGRGELRFYLNGRASTGPEGPLSVYLGLGVVGRTAVSEQDTLADPLRDPYDDFALAQNLRVLGAHLEYVNRDDPGKERFRVRAGRLHNIDSRLMLLIYDGASARLAITDQLGVSAYGGRRASLDRGFGDGRNDLPAQLVVGGAVDGRFGALSLELGHRYEEVQESHVSIALDPAPWLGLGLSGQLLFGGTAVEADKSNLAAIVRGDLNLSSDSYETSGWLLVEAQLGTDPRSFGRGGRAASLAEIQAVNGLPMSEARLDRIFFGPEPAHLHLELGATQWLTGFLAVSGGAFVRQPIGGDAQRSLRPGIVELWLGPELMLADSLRSGLEGRWSFENPGAVDRSFGLSGDGERSYRSLRLYAELPVHFGESSWTASLRPEGEVFSWSTEGPLSKTSGQLGYAGGLLLALKAESDLRIAGRYGLSSLPSLISERVDLVHDFEVVIGLVLMRWVAANTLAMALLFLPALAQAQMTQKCEGQSWAEIASERYGEARLGPLLARFNQKPDSERCEPGRFVRLFGTIQHEVKFGQTIKAIASRFCSGAGCEALLRTKNGLAAGAEPSAGQILQLPAELELSLGSRPDAELAALFGLPPLEEIRAYNGLKPKEPLKAGGTLYVPVFFELLAKGTAVAPVPAPPPPSVPPPATVPPPVDAPTPAPAPPPPPLEASVPAAQAAAITWPRILKVGTAARFDRFEHAPHRAMLDSDGCELCHKIDPREARGYLAVPKEACTPCHAGFLETAAPLRAGTLGLHFNHAQHLDPNGKARAQGYEVECANCHAEDEGGGVMSRPAHKECVKCHNPSEVKPVVASDCAGCHADKEAWDRLKLARANLDEHFRGGERGDDVVFGHSGHVRALSEGKTPRVACQRCHAAVEKAETLDVIEAQRMADCLVCHRGLRRAFDGEVSSLDRCRSCHFATSAAVAPSFGSVIDRPLSHTLAFRRRHQMAALADDDVCAQCHVELAGESGANCQRCHQQIRPADHSVRWREEPHGRAAARDPDRCATCHQRERCADCHATPPRDHFPRQVFALRHALSARISPRRCQTCHLPEVDCARCHDVATR